jgi:hypothetical protein
MAVGVDMAVADDGVSSFYKKMKRDNVELSFFIIKFNPAK